MLILACVSVVACIGQAFNIAIQMLVAALDHGKITLDFSRFNELLIELFLSVAIFVFGIWGFFYLIHRVL